MFILLQYAILSQNVSLFSAFHKKNIHPSSPMTKASSLSSAKQIRL